MTVRRHLAGRQGVAEDPGDVRRGCDVVRRSGDRPDPRRRARRQGVGGVDEHERGRLGAELVLEDLPRPGGLEIVKREAAGGQRPGCLRREGHREQDQHRPRGDDPPAAADGEATETIEGHA